ncbi:N-glycosylase/DNA lyase isoform X4 [Falco cherrug]|uniref:N-glycosylase/DNA lyase isoform X4 n=1 Tax=Falco cherrug TaxID=345164 RepID=UPI002479BB98|nr:N-glycosylase/DNA lyase isoform X4 [Falco cherrug]
MLRDSPAACPALWRCLPCPSAELRLDLVLASGQTFRWWQSSPGAWTGVLEGRVWTLRQEQDRLWYTLYGEEGDEEGGPAGAAKPGDAETDQILRDYFQLDVGLPALYRAWGAADPLFRKVAADFPGVRVLRQDPVECLLSFICTSNNHVSRITGMIERLCRTFGRRLCRLDARPFHAFPSLSALTGTDAEARLRALGFGYRAKFVSGTARAVAEGLGAEGLRQLRTVPYAEARRVLCTLPGVGTKVADCVCLMALDKAEAVPVDTHVWRIARQRYGMALGGRSLSPRAHQEIGDFFRGLWGPRAGWAQAVSTLLLGTRGSALAPNPSPVMPPHARSSSVLTSARARSRLAARIGPRGAEARTDVGTRPARDTPGGKEPGDPCACSQLGMDRGVGSCLSPAHCVPGRGCCPGQWGWGWSGLCPAHPGQSQAKRCWPLAFITSNKIETSIWKILLEHAGGGVGQCQDRHGGEGEGVGGGPERSPELGGDGGGGAS